VLMFPTADSSISTAAQEFNSIHSRFLRLQPNKTFGPDLFLRGEAALPITAGDSAIRGGCALRYLIFWDQLWSSEPNSVPLSHKDLLEKSRNVLDTYATGHKYRSTAFKEYVYKGHRQVVNKSKLWFVVVRRGHVITFIIILYYFGKAISRHLHQASTKISLFVQTATAPSPRP
jgi:hypothetical protein